MKKPESAEEQRVEPGRLARHLPEQQHRDAGHRHVEHARAEAAPAEEPVGQPAGDERADHARDLEAGDHPAGVGQFEMLGLREQRRAPIEHGVADRIDEEVGHREQPDVRVAEDILHGHGFPVVGLARRGLCLGCLRPRAARPTGGVSGKANHRNTEHRKASAAGTKKHSRQLP